MGMRDADGRRSHYASAGRSQSNDHLYVLGRAGDEFVETTGKLASLVDIIDGQKTEQLCHSIKYRVT